MSGVADEGEGINHVGEQFAKTTRRDFLGTATVATAATLTGPVRGEAQSAGTGIPAEGTKVAKRQLGPTQS